MRGSDRPASRQHVRLAWTAAVIAGTSLLAAGCGTARAPGAPATGQAGHATAASHAVTTVTDSGAVADSRAEATAYARQLLARLPLPPSARRMPWPSTPIASLEPSLPAALKAVVDLRLLYRVSWPVGHIDAYLLAHRPDGLLRESVAQTGHAAGGGIIASTESLSFAPQKLPAGIYLAVLAATIAPAPGGGSLVRADAEVAWYPPRSAAEHIDATAYRSVTVTSTSATPANSPATTRTYTAPSVLAELAAVVNGLHAAPTTVVNCPLIPASDDYRLVFRPTAHGAPQVVVSPSDCLFVGFTSAGRAQPDLYPASSLLRALRELG